MSWNKEHLEELLKSMSEDDARALINAHQQNERRKKIHKDPVQIGSLFAGAVGEPTIEQPAPLPCECCGFPVEHVWLPVGYGPEEFQGKWLHPGKHEACLDRERWAGIQMQDDTSDAFKRAMERAVVDAGLGDARYKRILDDTSNRLRGDAREFVSGNEPHLGLFGVGRKEQRIIAATSVYRWLYMQYMRAHSSRSAFVINESRWLIGLKETMNGGAHSVPSVFDLEAVDFVCIYGLGEMEHCSQWDKAQLATLLESREASQKKTLLITSVERDGLAQCESMSRRAYESVIDMTSIKKEAA